MLPDFQKEQCFLEGSQSSPVRPSDTSSKYGAMVEWYWQGKQKYREKKLSKCQSLNHRYHHGLHWDRTRAYAVRDRRKICVMPRPDTYTRRFATADSKTNTKHMKSTARPLPIRTATHGCYRHAQARRYTYIQSLIHTPPPPSYL